MPAFSGYFFFAHLVVKCLSKGGTNLYLKRLDIVGFKSFADKIRLEFLPGVTAVVGPNGSGKSNISDALRWVLGEQSIKNLRGSKMDDVIFAGSTQRKALGLAEVTMVLDNTDRSIPVEFSEIAVTRKLFRSGESDYLINKSSVRLKDIIELFYDTGLGKEAYSVIGQGKIDSILSVKAEDRRAIFEEAAGINKYKTRKQIAERKLEETDRNLVRLKDILSELGCQIGPLEAQSALAEQYLAIREQLTKVEINYLGGLVLRLQAELEESLQHKATLEEAYRSFESQENVIEAAIEEQRLLLLNQDNQLSQANEDFFRLQNQIDKFSEQVNFLNEKLADLDKQEQEQQGSLVASEERQTAILAQQQVIESETSGVKEQLLVDHQTLQEKESVMAAHNQLLAQLEAEEQTFKDEFIETLNEIAALKNKINSTSLQKDFISRQAQDCQKRQTILEKQVIQYQSEAEQHQERLDELEHEINHCRTTAADQTTQHGQIEQKLAGVERKNVEYKDKIRGLESKISLLDEMEKGFQGYFQGVKALLAEAVHEPFHQSIKGIIADLIQVQPGMELALETALGGNLQNVVIDTDQQAEAAVAYLKKYNKGRATFLPLNTIQASDNRMRQLQGVLEQHGCHPAISHLTFDPTYRKALIYLIGQTVVAPDIKTAIKISPKLDRSIRIVTPEGDLVVPGGAITGGSVDKRRLGLLSRRKEIEDLRKEKADSEVAFQKGQEIAGQFRAELQQLLESIKELTKQENEAKIRKAALDREYVTIQQNIKKTAQETAAYAEQLQELLSESGRFDLGQDELAQSVTAKEQYLKELENQLADLTAKMKTVKEDKEQLVEVITELRSRLSARRQEEHGKNALKEQLNRQLDGVCSAFQEISHKLSQIASEREKIKETIVLIGEKSFETKVKLQGQETAINRSKQERELTQQAIRELESKQRSHHRKSNEYQNQLHRLELQYNQKLMEIENVQHNLSEDYGLDWLSQYNPEWPLPAAPQQQIDDYKASIRDLGPVNVAAIDDFRQVKERFEFLTVQSEDLTKAKESLIKVINEIERTITKKFNETFDLIKTEFKKIFSELFEGGNSELILLDPEKPLESGIEIIAQPPGKKLQNLSLLSGGERAMTAIALLFAILAVKPAPFCVLDEIDATLDEVNVSRFSHLLELFSKELQFIVITHRRGTMEAANTLYGVTMEELGVSKLISLDLNEKAG